MTQDKEFKILDTLPEGVESFDDVPDCLTETCQKIQEKINQSCHARGWPAGTPFLIYQPDGLLCKCYCK